MDPVRAEIVARLSAIPDIGRVHPYQRFAERLSDLAALYAYNSQLRGWYVHRAALVRTSENRSVEVERVTWQIKGYMAVADVKATALTFDDLLDAVREAFRLDHLDGTTEVYFRDDEGEQAGLAVQASALCMFAGVLCHSATCSLQSKQFFRRKFDPRCPL